MSADASEPARHDLDAPLPALESRLLLVLLDERRKTKGRKGLRARLFADCARRPGKVQAALRALEADGLVDLHSEPTGGQLIDLGRARAARLTDAGIAFVLERLSVASGCRTTGATINALLGAVRELLQGKAGGAVSPPTPADPTGAHFADSPAAPAGPAASIAPVAASDAQTRPLAAKRAPDASLARTILDAFAQRERQEQGYVPIWSVRRALPAASREAFDRTLRALQREDLLYLVKLNDARDVAPDLVEDGILDPMRGRLFFIARGERAWTSTSGS